MAILLRTMGIRLMHVLLLMCLGLLVMFIFMIWLYQTEATHDSWIWFFNPLLIVHIRDLGNVAVAAALTLAVQFLFTQQTGIIKQGLYLFSLCIVCTFILWTGGRMAVFSSCFTLMLILVLAGLYKVISVQSALCIFLALIVSFYLVDLVAVFDWNGITRSSSTVSVVQQVATSGTGSLNQLSTGRWHMWSMSLKAMSESPIFGLGPYGYYFIPERTYGDQPHNLVVQFLVEWGIAGTFTVLMLLVGLAGKSLKALPQAFRSKDKDYIVSVSIVFALTLHALTGGTYFNVQPMYCLTLGFSGLCFSAYIAKPLGNKKSA
ncbi:MAG: O-antigen ligase family protein [Pseudomonadales bacterium]|nr:O-antigen ligase family protein [Pseudomonadales bacterium]